MSPQVKGDEDALYLRLYVWSQAVLKDEYVGGRSTFLTCRFGSQGPFYMYIHTYTCTFLVEE